MNRQTRRQFLAQTAAAGVLGWRALRAQGPQAVPVPGLEVGEPTSSFALRNVTVIDGTGKPARPGMTVVIAGSRIQSLGPTSATPLGPGVQAIDVNDKFLIPGLWDMHAHVWTSQDSVSPLFIPNGVTGLRTMGGARSQVQELVKRRDEIASRKRLGPRLVVGSPALNGTDPERGRLAVRNTVQDGADFIKVYDRLSRDAYFAIVDEAKKSGMTFAGHVSQPQVTLEEALNAGQVSIEHDFHIRFHIRDVLRGSDDAGVEALNESQVASLQQLFAVFRRNRTWFCPTLTGVPRGVPLLPQDPRWKYFDGDVRQLYERLPFVTRADEAPRQTRVHQANLSLTGAMHKAGVGILAGTDVRLGGPLPGFWLHEELKQLVAAGLNSMDALRTATYNPAQCLGLLATLGTIEAGKLSEMVLLDANPLDDISNTTKINMVFTGGRVYSRLALNAMLEANARN